MPLINVDHVSKFYGSFQALKNVSFQLREGEILGLLGPNGSGKSTLIKILMGIIRPSSGSVSVLGLDPERQGVEIRRLVGYVPENYYLYESMTPRELFDLVINVRRLNVGFAAYRLSKLISGFELWDYMDMMIGSLSKGTKQKIVVVMALLSDPKLLIMDEPLMGLDAPSVKLLKEMMKVKAEKGGGVLLSTHIMEIAERLCDRIVVLYNGEVVAVGSVNDIIELTRERGLEDAIIRISGRYGEIDEIIRALS